MDRQSDPEVRIREETGAIPAFWALGASFLRPDEVVINCPPVDGSHTAVWMLRPWTQPELTSWTSVDKPLNLPAGESVDVLVSISVPNSATDGESYAAIWAEVRSVADTENHIVSASRVGVRMYISVGSGNGPLSDFSIGALSANRSTTGIAEVQATVANTGGRALDLSGTLGLTNEPSGLSAGPFETATMTTLAPGDSAVLTVVLGADIPAGPWDARLELRSGLLAHEVTTQLTFPDAKREKAARPEQELNITFISIVAGVTALVIATALVALNRRKWRSR